jgi:hypothetical protein
MGIGYALYCRSCDFGLNTGWSHHAVSSSCVCTNCASIFSIKGTQSCWGVRDGEICHLYQSINSKKQRKRNRNRATELDTGVRVIGATSSQKITFPNGETSIIETFTFRLEAIKCPSCHLKGSLSLSLDDKDRCPQCRVGIIENRGMIEY